MFSLFLRQPLWEKICFVFALFIPLSFLIVVSFFQTHFPESPWHPLFKPKLFSCLVVWLFCCCFDYQCFHCLCFCCLLLFCYLLFVVVFVVLLLECEENECWLLAILLGFCCNASSKHVFRFRFLDLFCVLVLCFSKLECLLCCLVVKGNAIDSLLTLDLVFVHHLIFFWFSLVCLSLSRNKPQSLETQRKLKSKTQQKSRNSFFS